MLGLESTLYTAACSAYVHVPFCKHRCGYCNFTLVANREDLIDEYLDCLALEFQRQLHSPQPVNTLFIGGGTPTHLDDRQLERLLQALNYWLPLREGGEFSCEANPLDCTPQKLSCLRRFGVNRLSLGGQSFSPDKLKRLERDHSGEQLQQAIDVSRRYFDNLSLDLIFAAPGETLGQWRQEIATVLSMPIDHLSTYGLTIEPGANFYGRLLRGDLSELDADVQLDMYHHTIDALTAVGWKHYEVSNFCKPGFECRHNQAYWQGEPWLAFGPGAASFLPIDQAMAAVPTDDSINQRNDQQNDQRTQVRWQRATNHRSTTQYIRLIRSDQSPIHERDELDLEQTIRERLVFGLRQMAGIDLDDLAVLWPGKLDQLFQPYLQRYLDAGWLKQNGSRLQLTRAGLVLSDCLWPDLLG